MKRNYIRRILAAFMATAVMSSFTAVSIYAEPDMVVDDEADVEFEEDEEQEDPEIQPDPDEDGEEEAAPDETEDEEGAPPDEEAGDTPTDDDLAEGEAPSLPEPTYTPTGDIKMYATTTINIRKGPGTGYDKLGVLYEGADTTVKGYNGEWMAIDYYGGIGYVLGELLTETAPTATTTTTAAASPVDTAPEVIETETTVETEPVIEDTTAPEEEPVVTTSEEAAPTTKPVEEKPDDDDKENAAAVTDSSDKKSGGLQGILIAAISALAAFLLIGVLPVVIHRIHHKKLYQY